MKLLKTLLLVVCSVAATSALAQWQWLDKDGRKVFSDRPPPLDIPQNKIIKQPTRGVMAPAAATAPAEAASAPTAAASAPAAPASVPSGKDKELEKRKAQAEAEEAAKKKAEEQKLAKARAENCTRAKAAKATLESGKPMQYTNAQGETGFMDDVARSAEIKRVQGVIDSSCKP